MRSSSLRRSGVAVLALSTTLAVAGVSGTAFAATKPVTTKPAAKTTAAKTTTTDPAHGTISVATVLIDSLKWGGVLFALAVFGSVAYVWRVNTEAREQIAPAGGRWRRAAVGLILTATALATSALNCLALSSAS